MLSLSQLNHYYDALHENEMFLSAVHLVGNLAIDKQDEIYMRIIDNEMKIRYQTFTNRDNKKEGESPNKSTTPSNTD